MQERDGQHSTTDRLSPLARLAGEIGGLISTKLLVDVASPDEDLLTTGVLDSMTLIQLLVNLEEYFGIRIPMEELEIEDLRSIESIARLVDNHRLANASVSGGG